MKPGSALKELNSASDAFILQYYEQPDTLAAAFGHKLTRKDWEKIAHVKDTYQDVLFTAPIVATNVAYPLVQYMYDELRSHDRKFTFLVGHDSNLSAVGTALGVEEYELPNAIEKKTPIGSKIVVEKFVYRRRGICRPQHSLSICRSASRHDPARPRQSSDDLSLVAERT